MANQLDRSRFNVKGGGRVYVRQIYPDPSAGAATFLDLGVVGGGDFDDAHDMIPIYDGAGNLWDNQSGKQTAVITFDLLQSGLDEINLIRNSGGKFYEVYYPVLLSNGSTQELDAAICKFDQNLKLAFKVGHRTIPLKVYMLVPKAATIDRTGTIATNYDVANQQPFVLIESATAKGMPEDTAAALSTLVY
ncbi:MAG: hypothetical protein IMZ53_12960 [Thermoplasmata archaeon]|nr:hypothetical protein [Thermoplasmata archaeon]